MQQQRSLDLGGVGGGGLSAVEGHGGGEVGAQAHGQRVDHAAAEAEADDADLAGAIGAAFQPARGGDEIFGHFGPVDLAEQFAALLFVAGIAADAGESVGREGHVAEVRQAAGDIFNIWIQAAVFVDHQNAGQLLGPASAGRTK